jgi:hypothetical protein
VTGFGDLAFVVTLGITVIVPRVGLQSKHLYTQFSLSSKIASACLHIHLGRGTFFRLGEGHTIP